MDYPRKSLSPSPRRVFSTSNTNFLSGTFTFNRKQFSAALDAKLAANAESGEAFHLLASEMETVIAATVASATRIGVRGTNAAARFSVAYATVDAAAITEARAMVAESALTLRLQAPVGIRYVVQFSDALHHWRTFPESFEASGLVEEWSDGSAAFDGFTHLSCGVRLRRARAVATGDLEQEVCKKLSSGLAPGDIFSGCWRPVDGSHNVDRSRSAAVSVTTDPAGASVSRPNSHD